MKPLGYIEPPRSRLTRAQDCNSEWQLTRRRDSAAHWIICVLAVLIVGLGVVWWRQKHG
jgi:hypothetical protein